MRFEWLQFFFLNRIRLFFNRSDRIFGRSILFHISSQRLYSGDKVSRHLPQLTLTERTLTIDFLAQNILVSVENMRQMNSTYILFNHQNTDIFGDQMTLCVVIYSCHKRYFLPKITKIWKRHVM